MKFKVGDVVYLNSDKHAQEWLIPMTVIKIDEKGTVACMWRDEELQIQVTHIPEEALTEF